MNLCFLRSVLAEHRARQGHVPFLYIVSSIVCGISLECTPYLLPIIRYLFGSTQIHRLKFRPVEGDPKKDERHRVTQFRLPVLEMSHCLSQKAEHRFGQLIKPPLLCIASLR